MKCEQCDSEATVHELRVVNGKRAERHLCEKCARGQGIAIQTGLSVPEIIEKMLEQQTSAKTAEKPEAPRKTTQAATCPECGTTYTEFRQSGLLGCPTCYGSFEGQLGPLLERAHQGGTHHAGKLPKRALAGTKAPEPGKKAQSVLGGPEQRAGRMAALRKQLEEAIRSEQYERAATIRDELRKLTELESSPPPGQGAA
jgi:protein arginine kinase activator